MSGPHRTVRYEGLYPSQIRERFEQDAADAAADDWYPASESWEGGVLHVAYEHDPGRRARVAMALPPGPAPSGASSGHASAPVLRTTAPRWQRPAIGIAAVLGVALAASVTLVGFGGWDRPGTVYGNPVSLATPAAGGLGPRADAVTFLEANGFHGAVSPVGDGQERWLGEGAGGSVAELLGPARGPSAPPSPCSHRGRRRRRDRTAYRRAPLSSMRSPPAPRRGRPRIR
ncbi:MAG: hypothetical protein R3C32_04085 [Chloroflexota bacterium]